jgi:hypothetical protein
MKSNRPGLRDRGGEKHNESNLGNFVDLAALVNLARTTAAWDSLTAQRVMAHARAGTLDPGIVEALLLAVGLEV